VKDICPKKYNNFSEFYNEAFKIAQDIKKETIGMLAQQRVEYMRLNIERHILNGCIDMCKLCDSAIKQLGSSNNLLKFSIDNLVKNCITHSDVAYEDYIKIPFIAKNPSKIIKSNNGYDVMLLKCETKYYKLVIKTTKNKTENFIKSFHMIKEDRFNKY